MDVCKMQIDNLNIGKIREIAGLFELLQDKAKYDLDLELNALE